MQDVNPTADSVPPCPRCRATHVVRNGHGRTGAPNYLCRGCGRQFVERPAKGPIPEAARELVRRMLLERVGLRAIARITGLSRSWLQKFANDLYRDQTPLGTRTAPVRTGVGGKKKRELILECDELWSFVGSKANPWWVWVALDSETRRVVAMVVGDRSEDTARELWEALPPEYRDGALFCTDFWAAYRAVLPQDRHAEADKTDGLTNHIERFFCTLRQRCARFVRKSLSFSKCLFNHIGSLWYFIRHYNASLP